MMIEFVIPVNSAVRLSVYKLVLVLNRLTFRFSMHLFTKSGEVTLSNTKKLRSDYEVIDNQATVVADISDMRHAIETLRNTVYIGPFRNALNVTGGGTYFDISMGADAIKRWRTLKSGTSNAEAATASQIEEGIRSIFGFSTLSIDTSEDGSTLLLWIDGRRYSLNETGSGLTQFILVFLWAAFKRPELILIDEPELNLHPTLQLDFLTRLMELASYGIIFCTHVVGLARSSASTIYSIQQHGQGDSEVRAFEQTGNLAEFLGELSYGTYQDLGYRKVLLVEGSTEVLAFQQILRKYRMDHQVVLLHLGGSGIIKANSTEALAEIKRLSSDVAAIVDSEKNSVEEELAPERTAFKEDCESLGFKCHILERRALENYFPQRVVKHVLGEKYDELQPFEKLSASKMPWAKNDHWKLAREMTREELEESDLGVFLAHFLTV
jgi:energy-coupling factor transporter ATP-binding protein EcfA2